MNAVKMLRKKIHQKCITLCEVDEAVINLVEKISLCLKEKAIVEMYGVSELSKTHKAIIKRNDV